MNKNRNRAFSGLLLTSLFLVLMQVPSGAANQYKIHIYCDQNVFTYIQDSQGRKTGILPPDGKHTMDIPESDIFDTNILTDGPDEPPSVPNWAIWIKPEVQKPYKLIIIGKMEGEFRFGTNFSWTPSGGMSSLSGRIKPGREYRYRIFISPDLSKDNELTPMNYLLNWNNSPYAQDEECVRKGNIPVVFKLVHQNGATVDDVQAKLLVQKIVDEKPSGEPFDAKPASGEYNGNLFRYDPEKKQYIFLLNTSDMEPGNWQLYIHLDDGSKHSTRISIE